MKSQRERSCAQLLISKKDVYDTQNLTDVLKFYKCS